jgi:adenylate cyclase class 2
METEFEAKFYPVDKEAYRKKLKSVGAKLMLPERKMRRIIVDSVTHPQLKCDYIRVRDEGGLVRLSAKIHAGLKGKLSDQKEADVTVSDFEKTRQIIEAMGFDFDIYQETLRETWNLDGAEVVIDTWPGLEPYTEIESGSEADVRKVAEILGLSWENRIITSVKEVYSKVYKISIEAVSKKIANLTFENNPFSGLTKKWVGD